jgi:uncharacterized membrane protein YfcA
MIVLGLAFAALIGLSLGLLGGGGSILTVPILVYVLGFEAKPAIAASLVVVGTTSLFGAIGHLRAGNVNLRLALLFGVFAMVGAYVGSGFLSPLFSGTVQLAIFAVVMLLAAVSMFRARTKAAGEAGEVGRGASLPLTVGVGLAVGVLTGLVGVGGGFLIVPALVLLARLPMNQAVGTSLLVIAMNSASGFLGYLGQVSIPWGFLTLFTAMAVAGIFAGTYMVKFVSQEALKRGFAVFLVVMGIGILYQNRSVFGAGGRDGEGPAAANHVNHTLTPRTER